MDRQEGHQKHLNVKPTALRHWIKWGAVIFLAIDVAISIMVWPSIKLPMIGFFGQAMADSTETTALVAEGETTLTETLPAAETTSTSEAETTPEVSSEPTVETVPSKPTTGQTTMSSTNGPPGMDFSGYYYRDVPKEEALALFASVDNLDEFLKDRDMRINCTFDGKCESFAYYGFSETREENLYCFIESFTTGQFELRLCNASNLREYQVLASKPLPADRTAENEYDRWMKNYNSTKCINDEQLALILKTANLAPFVVQETAGIQAGGMTVSDDRMVVSCSFYRTTDRKTIIVYEDHNLNQMYYSVVPINEYALFMAGPFEGHVTLSPDADISNFRVIG